jgi:hypothetical protein
VRQSAFLTEKGRKKTTRKGNEGTYMGERATAVGKVETFGVGIIVNLIQGRDMAF